jgi:hypothetical protein
VTYVARCHTCGYDVELLTREAVIEAALHHSDRAGHGGVEIADQIHLRSAKRGDGDAE